MKDQTGVSNFLKKYPTYNGEGVTIAIFYSGVDPNYEGVQKIPLPNPKVIERFDCSGCGDVDISQKVTATDDGTILGISGRTLKISDKMKQENKHGDEYSIGIKGLYDLYPSKIREKFLNDLKIKEWDEPHKKAMADVAREIELFNAASNINSDNNLSLAEKLKKENLDDALDYLIKCDKKFECIRTSFDCIVYENRDGWVAVIDVNQEGDLESAMYLREYFKFQDIQSINDFLSISINVIDKSNVLELVQMCSSHETHAAAFGNSGDEFDGIAPGAKIVSCSIGDNRLGTMEMEIALGRAMKKVMELCRAGYRIHVINTSYAVKWSNSDYLCQLMMEIVNKYAVVWVAAVGNHGPALCTIVTPPNIVKNAIIGVSAYISPKMMEHLRQKLPPNVYTWTSSDPYIDGGEGVTIMAPGAALVPELQQLINGSSMASLNAAGNVALIISGLIQRNLTYSPFSIKRALCETATYVGHVDTFVRGNGLLNIEKAFDNLVQFHDAPEQNVGFIVQVGNHAKGIHLRTAIPVAEEHLVRVEFVFMNFQEIGPKDIVLNLRLYMVSRQPWVQVPTFLDFCHSILSFSVKVDPTALPVGVHKAAVKAYDSNNMKKGVLFEVPVTVVVPYVLDVTRSINFEAAIFSPNTIVRRFVNVPHGATCAVLQLETTDETKSNPPATFLVHTLQLLQSGNRLETKELCAVSIENPTTREFKCTDNNILEVCIAKHWSNAGDTNLIAKLKFNGIQLNEAQNRALISQRHLRSIQQSIETLIYINSDVQNRNIATLETPEPDGDEVLKLNQRNVVQGSERRSNDNQDGYCMAQIKKKRDGLIGVSLGIITVAAIWIAVKIF